MIVSCTNCGGGRDVSPLTEEDDFIWQCPKCNTRYEHKGKVRRKRIEPKVIKSTIENLYGRGKEEK